MLSGFLAYGLLHACCWLALVGAYRRAIRSPLHGAWRFPMGLFLLLLGQLTQCLPILWPLQGPLPQPGRSSHQTLGFLLLGLFGLSVLCGLVRFLSRLRGQPLQTECWCHGPSAHASLPEGAALEAQDRLEAWRLEAFGEGRLPVPWVLSECCTTPTLFGINPPRLLVPPDWVARHPDAHGALKRLSAWGEGMSYRACMVSWWIAQLNPILWPLADPLWRALERDGDLAWNEPPAGTAPGLRLVDGREGDARHRGSAWDLALVSVLATALPYGGLRALHHLGPFRLHAFWELLMNKEIIGFSVHGFEPTVEFRALPGEGGILPDGLLVDTLRSSGEFGCATVRVPLGLFDHEKLIPFGAKAIRVLMDWEVLERAPGPLELPAVKLAASEQGAIDAEGQQRLWTFYVRNVFLGQGDSGVLDLPMLIHTDARRLPGSRDVIYGPILFIPEGWRIAFRNYQVMAMEPSEVPPMPAGEGETFVAWYHRNGFKPATIDLQWRTGSTGGP